MTASTRGTALVRGLRTFATDVGEGFLEITHNSLALLGVLVVLLALVLGMRPDLRQQGEERLTNWLTERKIAAIGITPELTAIERATATNPQQLPQEQARVAFWISKKYRVAPEPVAALVAEAYEAGAENKLDPTLILAVMAIESRFNPFAQSAVGAQGLMQVMTDVHSDKYQHFGGEYAAFDPRSNLRVGVKILREYVTRAGSVQNGLKWYVGAANLRSDGGYASKVLAEHARLYQVAKGRPLSASSTPGLRADSQSRPGPAAQRGEQTAQNGTGVKVAVLGGE